jgi:predicted N-acetyltransferase YhbS
MKIERPKPADFNEIEWFLEECFNHSRHMFAYRWPHVSTPEMFDYANTHMIREDGRIVSLVKILPQEVVLDGREALMGGIGDVSTHPDYRGKGHMNLLMDHCIAKMAKMGCAFSILGGDRQRYQTWRYETCGMQVRLGLTMRGFEKNGRTQTVRVERFHGQRGVLEKARLAHEADLTFVRRSPKVWEKIFNDQMHTYLWYTQEGGFAYLVGLGERPGTELVELGGDRSLLLPLIYSVMKRYRFDTVPVLFPAVPEKMEPLLAVSSGWFSLEPYQMVRILSFTRTVEFLLGPAMPAGCTFRVKETGETHGKGGKVVELGTMDWVRALFGPFVPAAVPSDIRHLFPSRFYWWLIDHI